MEDVQEKVIVIDEARSEIVGELMRNVYIWMAGGLSLTGLIAWWVAGSPEMINFIFGNKVVFWGLIIAEFALVLILTAMLDSMSFLTSSICYVVYCALNGLLLSSIFLVYEIGSIGQVFFVSAGMFAVLAFIGTVTKKDLSRWGTFLTMALVGIIIASAVSLLMGRPESIWITIIGVLVFAGLTVYDAQKIRLIMLNQETINEGSMKLALLGALALYLDFINLFLKLLSLLGKKK